MLAQVTLRGKIRTRRELLQAVNEGRATILTVWRGQSHGGALKLTGNAGRVKMTAHPKTVMVDWDRRRAPSYAKTADTLRNIGLNPEYIRWDRTAKGWHLIVRLREKLTPASTVAVQLLLGSDRHREAYNLCRALSGAKSNRWNLLFEEKLT